MQFIVAYSFDLEFQIRFFISIKSQYKSLTWCLSLRQITFRLCWMLKGSDSFIFVFWNFIMKFFIAIIDFDLSNFLWIVWNALLRRFLSTLVYWVEDFVIKCPNRYKTWKLTRFRFVYSKISILFYLHFLYVLIVSKWVTGNLSKNDNFFTDFEIR